MAELANARHELFAVLIARADGPASACYRKAGFKPNGDAAAETGASRLLSSAKVDERVKELRALWAQDAGATTTKVVEVLRAVSEYDIGDILDWEWKLVGKRKVKTFVLTVKNLRDIPLAARMAIRSIKVGPNGPEVTFSDRVPAQRLVGLHLGMFQGETANTPPGPNITNNTTNVYVDRPRAESVEEWQARVSRTRMKQIEGKAE